MPEFPPFGTNDTTKKMEKKKIVITLSRVFPTELKSLKPYRK